MAILLQQIRGLSDNKWSGISGACYKLIGLDIHSVPGITKVQQKLTKESGDTVTELVKWAVTVSTGESFWFSADSGKIWRRSTAGAWLLVHTTTPAAGEAKCLGAKEYDGYLYWATQSRLHRIAMADAHATLANWTANAAEDWATFAVTDADYHPMAEQDLTMFIGDGNQVASVNSSGTFDNNALDINPPLRISAMIDYELDVLIGTITSTEVAKTQVIRWDCVSTSWNTSDPIDEPGINAFIRDDNFVYVQAGKKGSIYFYNGEQLEPYQVIPGDYTGTNAAIVYAGSVASFQRRPIFGLSNSSGNPTQQGVYQLGAYSRNYPKVLDLSWPISTGTLTSISVGAILVVNGGSDILVAWKDGSSYGVDKIDYTARYGSAYLETVVLAQEKRADKKTFQEASVLYAARPASTGFVISYDVNNSGSYTEMTMVNDTTMNAESGKAGVDCGSLQLKVAFTSSGNSTPEMEALDVVIDGI